MDRRQLLKILAASMTSRLVGLTAVALSSDVLAAAAQVSSSSSHNGDKPEVQDEAIRDLLDKARHFDKDYSDDVLLDVSFMPTMVHTVAHLDRVRKVIGHANFNLLTLDGLIKVCVKNPKLTPMTRGEIDFIEDIFYASASRYGFMGNRIAKSLTEDIKPNDLVKVARSGNFLFKGSSLALYERIRKDVGDSIVLTSGIRGVIKQAHLFMSKAVYTGGNLSRASRSVAPPGYSYHGVGDFDIGKKGLGYLNFTSEFQQTVEYKRLRDLGYVKNRYRENNKLGVRFEPWHVKAV